MGAARIPTPLWRRWQRFRYQAAPALCFLATVAACAYFWTHLGPTPHTLGEVEAVRVDVAAALDGVLEPMPHGYWTHFDAVEQGQVLARLDDAPLLAMLATLRSEVAQLEAEIGAAAAQLEFDAARADVEHRREAARLGWRLEQLRLDRLDRQAEIAAATIELQRLQTRHDYFVQLRSRDVVTELDMLENRLLRDETEARLAQLRVALAEVEQQRQRAIEQWTAFPAPLQAEVDRLLAPHRAAVAVQQSRIREIETQLAQLEVRAPIAGVISQIHLWPGQAARVGDPVVTIAAAHGRYILSYVRQEQRIRPSEDMVVAVRTRSRPPQLWRTTIERVGPQVEPIPEQQLRDPRFPEWGLPVRIRLPEGPFEARPGELLDVMLSPAPESLSADRS